MAKLAGFPVRGWFLSLNAISVKLSQEMTAPNKSPSGGRRQKQKSLQHSLLESSDSGSSSCHPSGSQLKTFENLRIFSSCEPISQLTDPDAPGHNHNPHSPTASCCANPKRHESLATHSAHNESKSSELMDAAFLISLRALDSQQW